MVRWTQDLVAGPLHYYFLTHFSPYPPPLRFAQVPFFLPLCFFGMWSICLIFSSLPSKRSPYFHTARLLGFLFPLWQQTRLEKTCFPTSMTWWTIWRFTWSATVIPRLTLSRFVPNWEMGLRYSFILYLFDANCFMFVRKSVEILIFFNLLFVRGLSGERAVYGNDNGEL